VILAAFRRFAARDVSDLQVSDTDYVFLRAANASILRMPPFRWTFYRSYLAMYRSRVSKDARAFRDLPVSEEFRRTIAGRIAAATRTVAACSSWYAVSYSILRGGFYVSVFASIAAILVAELLSPVHPPAVYTLSAMALSALIIALYASVSLAISPGWRFDLIWSIGWTALFVFAYRNANPTSFLHDVLRRFHLHLSGGTPAALNTFVGVTAQQLFLAGAVYSALIAVTSLVGGTIYVWTTSLKKSKPEEEIIQTLLLVLGYIKRYGDRAYTPQFRRYVSRQLDWIADRFAFDFLRPYRTKDPDSALWQSTAALRIASGVREIKRNVILPSNEVTERLQNRLILALGNAASGRWKYFPQGDCVQSKSATAWERFVVVMRGFASLAIPLAIAWFAVAKLPEPARSSLAIPFISLAVVNVLALLNPGGFERRIAATKTLTDVIRNK